MFTGWYGLIRGKLVPETEFVSADVARFKDPGSYEMLGRGASSNDKSTHHSKSDPLSPSEPMTPWPQAETPQSPPPAKSGRETPDYFGREARYKSPSRSFSAPKTPRSPEPFQGYGRETVQTPARPRAPPQVAYYMDPLSMNKT